MGTQDAGAPSVERLSPPGIEHLEVIARGGFAAVYRGWQPAFNRWVAVKILVGQLGQSSLHRLDQEARAVGSLSEHPHVVPVYEAGHVGGCPYLVMPYLTGGSLQQRMAPGRLDPNETVATGQAVADALAEAHRLGILHRDIKPANILFTAYGVPQLADFGVARFSESTLTGGLLAVTVAYAAPEVLSGRPASPLSDVYSLGATLYAALRGAPAFPAIEGEAPVAQAMRVVRDQPEPLQSCGVPAALAEIVEKSMAKDPAKRYRSAAEFRDALAALPTLTESPSHPATPLKRRGRSNRLLAGAAAAALLAGGGTAAGISLSSGPGPSSRPSAAAQRQPTAGSTAPRRMTPTTARASGSSSAGDLPPSADGATSPAAIAPATLTDTLRSYYALVDQHRLDRSWQWLSPSFQQRIGQAYYQQFWDSIRQVQVVSIQTGDGVAAITLRYVAVNGSTSTETADLGFEINGQGRVLIDTDHVTRS